MKTSRDGIEFIKRREGFRHKKYKDDAGLPTIGYGHLIQTGENFTMPITEVEGEALLTKDLQIAEKAIDRLVKIPLNQHQFDALVSFVFNVGVGNFVKSTLLKKLNAGDFVAAGGQFLVWNKVTDPKTRKKVFSQGLANRRKLEQAIFTRGIYNT